MAYSDVTIGAKLNTVKQDKKLAELLLAKINAVNTSNADAIKYLSVTGNTISFWKDAAHSGAADFTVDFPTEYFLDQAKTTLVNNFNFATGNYTGATDPNLDGKPVMVLAVKGVNAAGAETVTYSFVDLAYLSDTGKADKVSGAVAGNFAGLDANGNLTDSGKNASSFSKVTASATNGNINVDGTDITVYTPNIATDAEFDEMLVDVGLLAAAGA